LASANVDSVKTQLESVFDFQDEEIQLVKTSIYFESKNEVISSTLFSAAFYIDLSDFLILRNNSLSLSVYLKSSSDL